MFPLLSWCIAQMPGEDCRVPTLKKSAKACDTSAYLRYVQVMVNRANTTLWWPQVQAPHSPLFPQPAIEWEVGVVLWSGRRRHCAGIFGRRCGVFSGSAAVHGLPVFAPQFAGVGRAVGAIAAAQVGGGAVEVTAPAQAFRVGRVAGEFLGHGVARGMGRMPGQYASQWQLGAAASDRRFTAACPVSSNGCPQATHVRTAPHGTARTWHRTVRAQRVAAGMARTPGAAPCAGRHIAGAQAAVSAPGMVSLSATSNCCIWAWLITPSSSATTPMGLPLAIAVLAIWAALS